MADPGGFDTAGNNTIQSLFAQLRANQQQQNASRGVSATLPQADPYAHGGFSSQQLPQHSTLSHGYHAPTASSPIVSPHPQYPQPRHHSAILSPNLPSPVVESHGFPPGQSNADRTASLLNLLKFNQPSSGGQEPGSIAYPHTQVDRRASIQHASGRPQHGREISASDLVASFMSKSGPPDTQNPEGMPQLLPKPQTAAEPSKQPDNPQDFLLKLLNRPKPAQQESAPPLRKETSSIKSLENEPPEGAVNRLAANIANAAPRTTSPQAAEEPNSPKLKNPPLRIFGEDSSFPQPSTSEIEPGSKRTSSLFTYVNPFEQLAASSPRNRTPKMDQPRSGAGTPAIGIQKPIRDDAVIAVNGDDNKRKNNEISSGPSEPSVEKATNVDEAPASVASPAPSLLPDGRSKLEALMGIGADTRNAASVAGALSEVEGQIDQQVEEALLKAEQEQEANDNETLKPESSTDLKASDEPELEDELHDLAADVKQELEKEDNNGALEEAMPAPVAEAVKDVIEDLAHGNVADSWESADGGESTAEEGQKRIVTVYNFPMRPFVSITIKSSHQQALQLRQDSVMDIARLKKEFDQVDRTLATSTNNFIVYAMSKSGGLRIIRQDDGKDKQIFRTTQDRIFSVTLSTAPPGSPAAGTEAVLATGVSGSVYWTTLLNPSEDIFEDDDVGSKGLVLPPMPAHDDNTSGGQLKTRAKKSSRHPEYFAIGRGRSIHVVWPLVAGSSKYLVKGKSRIVDSEKYFNERCLKITTGKAGKDFTFSEDDTLIVSLDKAGRLRFWDIRPLVDPINGTQTKIAPIEVKVPLMTLFTIAPSEKSWPTSVLFVDKYRPYTKGIALRYLLVGMKQNHTFQLWDLALGKAVQELNFPHENESDAICSVSYHPNSGIIVVGHPTRNSIFFVHLSAPKYNLPAMSQAKYIQKLATSDDSIPKPDATAIMSGLREVSFDSKGQLRSVDMLPTPAISLDVSDREDPVLFELYAMHSKGVTCLNIKREDLGWSKENKVLRPVDAEIEGVISVKDLRDLPPVVSNEAPSTVSEGPAVPSTLRTAPAGSKGLPKEIVKKEAPLSPRPTTPLTSEATVIASTLARVESKQDAARAATMNGNRDIGGGDKGEKRKKKRAEAIARGVDQPSSAVTNGENTTPSTEPSLNSFMAPADASKMNAKNASETIGSPTPNISSRPVAAEESINLGISGEWLNKELVKIEKGVSAEFGRVLGRELDEIYRRFDADKRALDAASAAKHDAVLRLVSSTLSENVEKNLARMIGTSIEQVVLPSVADTAAVTLDRRLSDGLTQNLHQSIPLELRRALPDAIAKALQGPEVLRAISDLVAGRIASQVESEFTSVLHNTITPAFKSLAISTAQKMAGDVERRVGEQIRKSDIQRHNDSLKIDQLTNLVRGLSETVHTMATAQSDFQSEILKLQRSLVQNHDESTARTASVEHRHPSSSQAEEYEEKSEEQQELETIASLMREGNFEEGTIQWLQSSHQAELFDRFFVRCNPEYMRSLSPLVTLSVSAAVTSSLNDNLLERFHWLETIFATLDTRDPDILEVAPKIMDVLSQRLEGLYMRIAETNPHDPALRMIPPLARRARDLKSTVG
ncbi:hypothetical protein L228DRAFT_176235 [Xylona heveae TC161]|uniref:EDC4-like protein pdc1 beta-propeller domain-containing protein n=1 Tax=Xylona heveae (strain CBS 132557 / TC161) TaxID=1328760 RepID=A0A165AKR3_XYLHT|nr:hypothetical protein L228DRAFT_176235 [Xylona heveae TC161]KZF20649.1 hypothetical protein L228DRAFT_176235 [Xylona heveae TC161]